MAIRTPIENADRLAAYTAEKLGGADLLAGHERAMLAHLAVLTEADHMRAMHFIARAAANFGIVDPKRPDLPDCMRSPTARRQSRLLASRT